MKRQYRINALRHHPDKNSSPDATVQFQSIRDAYEYLSDNPPPIENLSYIDMLKEFLNTKSPIIQIIISKLSHVCEDNASKFIHSIDKFTLMDIYRNQEILYIPDFLLEKIKQTIISKTQDDECILLNPSLDDLLSDNVYKLSINKLTYLVPLWHHELIYDNSGCDVYVECHPILPENIIIDDNNNIIIFLKYCISDILHKDVVNVIIGERNFTFSPNELRVLKRQQLTRMGIGISRVKSKNVYDVSTRGDIIFDIELI